MSHWRGYSNYKITTWEASGIATNPGALNISNWKPHRLDNNSTIKAGMTAYMDITVATSNALASAGTITLNFGSVNLSTPVYAGHSTL